MILTRAPLRITLGGGGTDLSPYVEEHGAFFITAAIDKYVHVALNPIYEDRYLLRYSDHESVSHIRAIQHPIIRTAFSIYEVAPGIELTSFADAPAGTGLGSSAAFTCALLQALATWYGDPAPTPMVLATDATYIEKTLLGRSIGQQDQLATTHPGINAFTIDPEGGCADDGTPQPGGQVHQEVAEPIWTPTTSVLTDHLLLFYTGLGSRDASRWLTTYPPSTEQLHRIKRIGLDAWVALMSDDLPGFGDLLHEHWKVKSEFTPGHQTIADAYRVAGSAGARGGKLVGAGGAGYLMLYADEPEALRAAMAKNFPLMPEMKWKLDFKGVDSCRW